MASSSHGLPLGAGGGADPLLLPPPHNPPPVPLSSFSAGYGRGRGSHSSLAPGGPSRTRRLSPRHSPYNSAPQSPNPSLGSASPGTPTLTPPTHPQLGGESPMSVLPEGDSEGGATPRAAPPPSPGLTAIPT